MEWMSAALRRLLALVAGLSVVARGVLLRAEHGLESDADSHHGFMAKEIHTFREKILFRFSQVDVDGDGTVSFAEMQKGFGHEPAHAGEEVLRRMLAECTGGDEGVRSCSREQMERSLNAWGGSHEARATVALLQAGSRAGFGHVHLEPSAQDEVPCGPSAAEAPAPGFEGIKCTVTGAQCFNATGSLLAWSLTDVCQERACVCEATKETKRLAKLGLMGALGVTSTTNFSDPRDELLAPSCGADWTSIKVLGTIEDVNKVMTPFDQMMTRRLWPMFVDDEYNETDPLANRVATEAALYKSARHRTTKGGPLEKVCMISWQPTRQESDWKLNFLMGTMPFRYAPPDVTSRFNLGYTLAYESIRDELKRTFEEECCSADFQAEKLVISGHSLGGALAEFNAVDVVTNWQCGGRDLGAKDVSVVLAAPPVDAMKSSVINKVFSCNDPAACLSGSVVTLVSHGDYAGDAGKMDAQTRSSPMHPSDITKLSCQPIPEGANLDPNVSESKYSMKWCHGLYSYLPILEADLVGAAGWGSSCDGVCGDPNRMVQCNQWVLTDASRTGCSLANASRLLPPTPCPDSRWVPEEERCDCHFDLCTELTTNGCNSR